MEDEDRQRDMVYYCVFEKEFSVYKMKKLQQMYKDALLSYTKLHKLKVVAKLVEHKQDTFLTFLL